MSNLTIFYDGGCPLCSREIAHYRELETYSKLVWIDVTRTPNLHAEYGITTEQAMQRFHVRDIAGKWHIGAEGFMILWLQLPGYRWLTRISELLHLRPLLNLAYNSFAGWHFRKRCPSGTCELTHGV